MNRRKSGVLLHVTSLPSPFGIGDLGPSALRFVDFLCESKQGLWQILPVNPTDLACSSSPYHATSSFAGNPFLISPELLEADGLLDGSDLAPLPSNDPGLVDFHSVSIYKQDLFQKAFERFKRAPERSKYHQFCMGNGFWLDDFALFMSLKDHYGGIIWNEWPKAVRDREPEALREMENLLRESVEMKKFLQFIFFRQWKSLKDYCKEKDIEVIGDIPIYAVYDSADVWVHPNLFNLDEKMNPRTLAGVPPDYFSKTGQLWGNPVYRWGALKDSGYEWWLRKIGHCLSLFDLLRVDHFRGFVGYWQVPAGETNAIRGEWIDGPGMDFFEHLASRFKPLPLIAEDLGTITPDVHALMDRFGIPGMKVLLFAFGGDPGENPYLPHNYVPDSVVYTGTHDNNPVRAWLEHEASEEELKRVFQYLGKEPSIDDFHWDLIRLAMMSVAQRAVFPLQDILGLGSEARMNRPASNEGNWGWRFSPEQVTIPVIRRLLEMTETYGRASKKRS